MAAAEAMGARVTKVLTTHNHYDHAGGNRKIAKLVKGIEIYGGRGDGAGESSTPSVLSTPPNVSVHIVCSRHLDAPS